MFSKLTLLLCFLAVTHAKIYNGMGEPFDGRKNAGIEPYLGFRLPLSSRIVGGQEANRGEFPHQITLQYGSPPFLNHLCGGSVINNHWILTAAHCPLAVSSTLYVKAGKHSMKSTERFEQVAKVVKTFVHENYPGGVAPYDIALLKLEKPLVFDEYVQPISIPQANSEVDGDVVLSGWGSTSSSGFGSPDILRKVKIPIVDNKTCKKAIEDLTGSAPVAASNVCTGPLTGGVSACSGDSGGPLIKVKENGKSEIVGIVSWGIIPCGTYGAPSVYTRVASYVDWIENVVTNH